MYYRGRSGRVWYFIYDRRKAMDRFEDLIYHTVYQPANCGVHERGDVTTHRGRFFVSGLVQ